MSEFELYKDPALHASSGKCYLSAANYSTLAYALHADDQAAQIGTDRAVFRVAPVGSGLTHALCVPNGTSGSTGLQQDGDGIYTLTTATQANLTPPNGSLAQLPAAKNVLLMAIGKSTTGGTRVNAVIGDTTSGVGFNSNAVWRVDVSNVGAAPTLSPTIPPASAYCSALSYFRTSGVVDEVLAIHVAGSGLSWPIHNGSTTFGACSALVTGSPIPTPTNVFTFNALQNANIGNVQGRLKFMALFYPTVDIPDAVLVAAARWMANFADKGWMYPGLMPYLK